LHIQEGVTITVMAIVIGVVSLDFLAIGSFDLFLAGV
jgi:hypothetical protein